MLPSILLLLVCACGLDTWFLVPFFLWIVAFVTILRLLIPRLAKTAQRQADARS